MSKPKSHTIMGDKNDLLCTHCGEREKLPMPLIVTHFGDIAAGFEKRHKNCEKVWEWPVADPKTEMHYKAIAENVKWWIENGEHGISALTMLKKIGNHNLLGGRGSSHPHDPDDFRRCHLFLNAVPQFRVPVNLNKMKLESKVWEKLVENWDLLTSMLLEQMATGEDKGMFKLMKSLGC